MGEVIEKKDVNGSVSKETERIFCRILKQGIYKELYKRHLLSDEQLKLLVKDK